MGSITDISSEGYEPSAGDRAAYIVGRHPYVLRFWQSMVKEIATLGEDIPWNPLTPYSHFCDTCEEPPASLVQEFDDALLDLAKGNLVHAAILVELHRAMDQLSYVCQQMTSRIADDDREGVKTLYYASHEYWIVVEQLSDSVLNEQMSWNQLGIALGASVLDASSDLLSPLFSTLASIARQAQLDVLSPHIEKVSELDLLADSEWEVNGIGSFDTTNAIVECLYNLDASILEALASSKQDECLLLINEAEECIVFLGQRFNFDQFRDKAAGGLKCFIELARRPNEEIRYSQLVNFTDLVIEPERLKEYISGLLNVLSPAAKKYESRSSSNPHKLMERAFIANRPKRGVHEGAYALRLSRKLIQFVGA